MKIQSIYISNFRCFGKEPEKIELSENITTFLGSNGSGKTACLIALSKLFGVTRKERTINPEDFHIPISGEQSSFLWIEAILKPEKNNSSDYAHIFNNACIDKEDLYCRIRLEAIRKENSTIEDDIEQNIYFITTPLGNNNSDEIEEKDKRRIYAAERSSIHVHYLPATRSANNELQSAIRYSLLGRLLKAIQWSEDIECFIKNEGNKIEGKFSKEPAIQEITNEIINKWRGLYDLKKENTPKLSIFSNDLDNIIRRLEITFSPTNKGNEKNLQQLSDGQKTLFYFALITTIFAFECKIKQKKTDAALIEDKINIIEDKINIPALTIFAIEEPENHLAPFYLSRLIAQIEDLAKNQDVQGVFTTHSPSIIGRIPPSDIRFFQYQNKTANSNIKSLDLPILDDKVFETKYIRNAVLAYPEIYFARFVIFVEGDSEKIILPKLMQIIGIDLDTTFTAVVPLGGRHVNYFWKLVNDLNIPYVTLLDLDLGRRGGGTQRLQYAYTQLDKVNKPSNTLLQNDLSLQDINKYIKELETKGIFFSYPLDIDMSMLYTFTDTYQKTLKSNSKRTENAALEASNVTQDSFYHVKPLDVYKPLFIKYAHLFHTKSKPVTHLEALTHLEEKNIDLKDLPQELKNLFTYIKTKLNNE